MFILIDKGFSYMESSFKLLVNHDIPENEGKKKRHLLNSALL